MEKKERKKILIITASTKGGGAAHISDLTHSLSRKEFDVHFLGPNNGPFFTPIKSSVAETLVIPIRSNPVKTFTQILGHVRSFRPDVIHTHGKGGGAFGRIIGPLLGVPVVHTFHGLHYEEYGMVERFFYFGLERLLSKLTKRHICVGDEEFRQAEKLSFCSKGNTSVVPNGIDFENYAQPLSKTACREKLGLPTDKFIVGAIARITKQKGLEFLINGFLEAQSVDDSLHLAIVGDADTDINYEDRILSMGKHPAISFLGFQENIPQVFSSFDIYISTALWEGLPITLIESCASRCFPIVSDIPPHHEVLGETGRELFFEPKSNMAVKEKIIWAKRLDTETKEKLVSDIYNSTLKRFSLNEMIESTLTIYENTTVP